MKVYVIVFLVRSWRVLRYGVNVAALRLLGSSSSGTLTVNIVSSFIMGASAGYFTLKADPG